MDERLVAQGWCATVVKQIWSNQNPLGQYYASLLGPPHRKLDHNNCVADDKDCAVMKKLPIGNVTHEKDDCQCRILLVDRLQLAEIIGKTKIPVSSLFLEE